MGPGEGTVLIFDAVSNLHENKILLSSVVVPKVNLHLEKGMD